MALPKRRHSKARTRKGRTHKKLSLPQVTLCPQCTEPKLPHRVCLSCGSYKGNTVVDVKEV